jgi:hypothetical protein
VALRICRELPLSWLPKGLGCIAGHQKPVPPCAHHRLSKSRHIRSSDGATTVTTGFAAFTIHYITFNMTGREQTPNATKSALWIQCSPSPLDNMAPDGEGQLSCLMMPCSTSERYDFFLAASWQMQCRSMGFGLLLYNLGVPVAFQLHCKVLKSWSFFDDFSIDSPKQYVLDVGTRHKTSLRIS